MLAQFHRHRHEPLAATDNLNFGNPERPEIMGQLVFAIKGIGAACKALDFPIVSGNVCGSTKPTAPAFCRHRQSAALA